MDFSAIAVLCIGDLMLDRFVDCDMERVSPEAPVPVLRRRRTREMLGGVGNVAGNVAALGGRAVLAGALGHDEAGGAVRRILAADPRIESACIQTPGRPTTCKTRLLAGNQQVVRVDDEDAAALDDAGPLLDAVRPWLDRVGAVVLSDYGKGVLTPQTIRALVELARVPVFVDPKSRDFTRYHGATCITPNLRELAAASGMAVDTEAAVVAASRAVMAKSGARAILATRSEKGMVLVEADGAVTSVPTRPREVFDVSGAGDTVIATMALCHAAGHSLAHATHIANAAAGVVVSKLGTATASVAEVLHELGSQDLPGGLQPQEQALDLVRGWKAQGLVVGFTNGCFDILHPGHIALLARARGECDRLVVALNSDASVRRLKGPNRPANTLRERALVMEAVRHVDCVVSFEDDTPLALIRALLPDVLVKGADYTEAQVVGAEPVRQAGGRVVLAPLVPQQSTTATLARLRATA